MTETDMTVLREIPLNQLHPRVVSARGLDPLDVIDHALTDPWYDAAVSGWPADLHRRAQERRTARQAAQHAAEVERLLAGQQALLAKILLVGEQLVAALLAEPIGGPERISGAGTGTPQAVSKTAIKPTRR